MVRLTLTRGGVMGLALLPMILATEEAANALRGAEVRFIVLAVVATAAVFPIMRAVALFVRWNSGGCFCSVISSHRNKFKTEDVPHDSIVFAVPR